MKRTSKFISLVLSMVLLFSIIPVSVLTANAAATPIFELICDQPSAEIGDVITVDVVVSKSSKLCGLTLDVVYEPSRLEVVDVVNGNSFGYEVNNPTYRNNVIRFVGTSTGHISDTSTTIMTITFKVTDSCSQLYFIVSEAYLDDGTTSGVNITNQADMAAKSLNIHNFQNNACVVCGCDVPDGVIIFNISNPSRTEIRNKDGIILHATVQGDATGTTVKWQANNNNFKTQQDGNNLTIISDDDGDTTFTALLYGTNGKLIASESIVMHSKAGFFDKIGGFFRSLFRTTKIYES